MDQRTKKIRDMIDVIKYQKWSQAGQEKKDNRWSRRLLDQYPVYGKRSMKIPQRDKIKAFTTKHRQSWLSWKKLEKKNRKTLSCSGLAKADHD